MIKRTLFFLLFFFYLFVTYAQDEVTLYVPHPKLDTLCTHAFIDFDASQKFGCEYLITQLLNLTEYPPEDTLSFIWNVFNDAHSSNFVYTEENPDIFLHEAGHYHVKLTVTNMQGDVDSLVKYNLIAIDSMPQINFTYTPENALFAEYLGEVEFINLTDSQLLNDSAVVWYWEMGDHVINTKEWSPVHLFSSWGDYHTTFHLKTKNGCKVAMTKTITIEDNLFFPDTLRKNAPPASSIFAITNLNTYIPKDDHNEFRTNHLFVYNAQGETVYEQKNYDSYIKNHMVVEGFHALRATDLEVGIYYYSFYYKGKNKMVHYAGAVVII